VDRLGAGIPGLIPAQEKTWGQQLPIVGKVENGLVFSSGGGQTN